MPTISMTAEQKALSVDIRRHCDAFLKRITYGECKAFCPFHEVHSKYGYPLCCDKAIVEHYDEVKAIMDKECAKRAHV